MRITLAVALVAVSGSSVLAQESSQIGTITDGSAGEISTISVIDSEALETAAPVVYQSATVGDRAAGVVDAASSVVGNIEGAIEGAVVTEPSSVVSGEVIQSEPVYSEVAPMEGGTVVSDGSTMITGAPMADAPMAATPSCGCGNTGAAPVTYSSAPAPVVTYSSAPVQYSAPVSNPCCNQPRRGFFRTLFGN